MGTTMLIKRLYFFTLIALLFAQCQKDSPNLNVKTKLKKVDLENISPKELVKLMSKNSLTKEEEIVIDKRYKSLSETELEEFHNLKIDENLKDENDFDNSKDGFIDDDEYPTSSELKEMTKKILDQSILEFGVPFNKLSIDQRRKLINEDFAKLLQENRLKKEGKSVKTESRETCDVERYPYYLYPTDYYFYTDRPYSTYRKRKSSYNQKWCDVEYFFSLEESENLVSGKDKKTRKALRDADFLKKRKISYYDSSGRIVRATGVLISMNAIIYNVSRPYNLKIYLRDDSW